MERNGTQPIEIEQKVLSNLQEFVADLGHAHAARIINTDSVLDKDLGIGSLERVELFSRLEQSLGIQLPHELLYEAETVNDLIRALQKNELQQTEIQHVQKPVLDPTAPIAESKETLVEVLRGYAEIDPSRPHIYLQADTGEEQIITYGMLRDVANAVAIGLLHFGLQPGDTVALMLPTSKDFFYAFFGVLFAGCIPVPIYPPLRPKRLEEYVRKEAGILRNAEVKLLITGFGIETIAHPLQHFIPSLRAVMNVTDLTRLTGALPNIRIRSNDPALIQYTSGSTGNPKGVLLSHANLLANIHAIGMAIKVCPTDIAVSWLPLYHDMGLIGAWLGCLTFCIPLVILSPITFLTQPKRWLWAIHTHRATLSAAPNFAYELCVRKIQDKEIEGLDLSSWRCAFNGAEAVNPSTLTRFINRFEPYGFHPETLLPVYGLAESSAGLTISPLGRPARVDKIVREAFESLHIAVPAATKEASPLRFVSSGVPMPGHEVRIVNENNIEVQERVEGRLQFRGPSTMLGYYHAPEATQSIYFDGWLDSGDYAYQADREIFITGRRKDVIIKSGRNLYPEELEEIAGNINKVRKGCVAAFGVMDPKLGTEKIVVLAETKEEEIRDREEITAKIFEEITTAIGIPPDVVHLVPPGTILKTSSGKLRRTSIREAYLQNKLIQRNRQAWVEMVKLWLLTIAPIARKYARRAGKLLYAAYAYFMLIATILPVWILAMTLPTKDKKITRLIQYWARIFLWLIGIKPKVSGKAYLSQKAPMIFVANHASYLDAIVLLAALRLDFVFVAKQELIKVPVIRTFMNKQAYITVDRTSMAKGLLDTQHIEQVLQQGQSVLVFPEGTFVRAKGIQPFKLGAFKAAVETSSQICAVALQGTRQFMPEGSILPLRTAVTVTIFEPLQPMSKDWHEMTRLRDVTREQIAQATGDPLFETTTVNR